MDGDSQDNYALETVQQTPRNVTQTSRLTSPNTGRGGEVASWPPRDRISFADATEVRARVQSCASALGLRGARAATLAAVLDLTVGWKRIADDAVALRHVAERIPGRPGRRGYDLKTLGRALKGLAADTLIVYRPAQGRGARAFIAIHPRFVEGVAVLDRDESGRVIAPAKSVDSVTFSRGPYKEYISKKKKYPPTPQQRPRREPVADTRPSVVEICGADTAAVLRRLPGPLGDLTGKPRWRLGRAIRDTLRAGWLPEQILEVLAAPMPASLAAPSALAIWRLMQNMPGAGPRLKPLQQAWDHEQSRREQQSTDVTTARWYGEVLAVTGPEQRAQLLDADTAHFGRTSRSPVAALAAAGRRVTRLYPDLGLGEALRRWAADVLSAGPINPAAAPLVAGGGLLVDLAIGERCVMCDQHAGSPRPQLPLMSTVCDQCWPMIAAELAADLEAVCA